MGISLFGYFGCFLGLTGVLSCVIEGFLGFFGDFWVLGVAGVLSGVTLGMFGGLGILG